MQFYIPELGTPIILAEDWTFRVINEKRNSGLAKLMDRDKEGDWYFPFGSKEASQDWHEAEGRFTSRRRVPIEPGDYTWPAGTTLVVDRIYIRKGNEEFSSVTFITRVKGKQVRFFAHLDDVNRIVF